jgi:hypothetical protein
MSHCARTSTSSSCRREDYRGPARRAADRGRGGIANSGGDQIPSLLSAGNLVYRISRSNENVGFGNIIFSYSFDGITLTNFRSRAVTTNTRRAGIVAGPSSPDYTYVSSAGELFAETLVF